MPIRRQSKKYLHFAGNEGIMCMYSLYNGARSVYGHIGAHAGALNPMQVIGFENDLFVRLYVQKRTVPVGMNPAGLFNQNIVENIIRNAA